MILFYKHIERRVVRVRTHKVKDKLRNSPLLSVLSKYAENVIIHSDKVTEVLLV